MNYNCKPVDEDMTEFAPENNDLPPISNLAEAFIGKKVDKAFSPKKIFPTDKELVYSVYKEGSPVHFDYVPNRVNIVYDENNIIEDISYG
ncbi:hypothetical protein K502DRAFT_368124 [Neoconidiobolus thromboides FSU 785]|nr:hypothetical protein K502DRAFT_368124 [Neoconidiobolus thromboides FSU 785]